MIFQVWREVKMSGISYNEMEYETYDIVYALRETECLALDENVSVRIVYETDYEEYPYGIRAITLTSTTLGNNSVGARDWIGQSR